VYNIYLFIIRYPESQCNWEKHTSARIGSGRILVVHTERARYKPGDTVRARVLALKAELTPVHGVVSTISGIEKPKDVNTNADNLNPSQNNGPNKLIQFYPSFSI
jgi:hypothetical protein